MKKKNIFIGTIVSAAAALAVAVSAAGYGIAPLNAQYIHNKADTPEGSQPYSSSSNAETSAEQSTTEQAEVTAPAPAANLPVANSKKAETKVTTANSAAPSKSSQDCDTGVQTQPKQTQPKQSQPQTDVKQWAGNGSIKEICEQILGKKLTANQDCDNIWGGTITLPVNPNCPDNNTGSGNSGGSKPDTKPVPPQEKPDTGPVPPQEKPDTKPQPPQEKPELPSSGSFSKMQTEVLDLVNKARKENGLSPLTLDSKLSDVATLKSQDMANLGYFDHTSPTYGSPFDMMKQFGVSYTAAGENIAMGQTSSQQVMTGWMNSSGHRANILNSSFTKLGVGIAKNSKGQLYWTQMFIKG